MGSSCFSIDIVRHLFTQDLSFSVAIYLVFESSLNLCDVSLVM